jgi:hypothetical protein
MVPMVERIYENKLPNNFKLPASAKSFYERTLPLFKSRGVIAPDLNTPFITSGKRFDTQFPMYLRQDNHWSSIGGVEGARIVAQTIRAELQSTLEKIPNVKYDLEWSEPEEFNGNYYKLLPEADRAKIQRESYKPVNFVGQNANDLLNVSQPEIAVIGTSFTANRNFGFSDGLAYYLSKETLNAAESGKGPWTPMFNYLDSDNFQNTPPRILIWEIPEAFMLRSMKPIDGTDEWSRNYFIIQSAANLSGDCGKAGKTPQSINGVEFTTQAGTASSPSTSAKSLVRYSFKNPLRIDHYISLKVKSASTSSIYLETVSNKPNSYYANLGAYNVEHRVNIPMYTMADGKVSSVNLRSALGSDLTVTDVKLCQMPSEMMNLLTGSRDASTDNPKAVIASDPNR